MLSALVAISLLAGSFIAEGTLHPARRPVLASDEAQTQIIARNHHAELRDAVVVARDSTTLRAWNVHPQKSNGEVVILFHGLSDNRMGMVGYADMLLNHGFAVLMPDARAHGASGGPLATYGLLESDDIRRWLDWLQQNQHPKCIFGFGESMGAAQVLQSLKNELRFCAVAAESPFASFREIAYDRVGQFFHTGPWLGRTMLRPIVEAAFLYARWKYRLNFEQLSPRAVVAATSVPVLLIHGQEDSNIPVRHSRLIVAGKPELALWEVPGADHCGAITVAPQELEQKLVGWFAAHGRRESLSTSRREQLR
jgi:alpha-beta hydrolase superfamily lysophospholipase